MMQDRVVLNPSQTTSVSTGAVWLPDLKVPTYRVLLSGLTASARGVSAKKVMMRCGRPPSAAPRLSGLNTQTSERPTLGVVSCASPAPGTPASDGSVRCWPRWAVVMKALAGEPAKTTSRGSSPTSRVRTTRGVPLRLTTLTLSDRWLTTQTSVLLRAATATGSRPTGTRVISCRLPLLIWKMSRVLFGVLTANSLVPSGDLASGRT